MPSGDRKAKVSPRDREHMRSLGERLDAQLRDRRRESQQSGLGARLEEALRLSDDWWSTHKMPQKPAPRFSMQRLWREAQRSQNNAG